MQKFRAAASLIIGAALLSAAGAHAQAPSSQAYPNKLIRIFTAEPGASTDFAVRMIAQGLSAKFGQPVVVENRGGASGVFAVQAVARGQPDGYSLLYYPDSLWLAPFLRSDVPYDPVKDLTAITVAAMSPNILVVHPSLPVKSVKEFIALAKSRPGKLNYATGASGSSNHLAGELFQAMAGVKMVRIPFKGAGPAVIALVGGQVDLMFASTNSAWPHVKSGRLRALGIASLKPSELAPGLPTLAAAGLPGFEAASMHGAFAPIRTPPAVVSLLNQEMVRILSQPDVKQKLASAGLDIVANTPDEASAKVKSEMAKWGKVIRDTGIRED
jgi:tripartite-type tricarboxylate transporter receptor subunit TctC